jgi:hypothetical protein
MRSPGFAAAGNRTIPARTAPSNRHEFLRVIRGRPPSARRWFPSRLGLRALTVASTAGTPTLINDNYCWPEWLRMTAEVETSLCVKGRTRNAVTSIFAGSAQCRQSQECRPVLSAP